MISQSKNDEKSNDRLSVRRDILDTFNVFLTMPHHGQQKIFITNVCDNGLAFTSTPGLHYNEDSIIDCYFYLNINIRIPLKIKIRHIYEEFGAPNIGCELIKSDEKAYNAYINFINLLNSLASFIDI